MGDYGNQQLLFLNARFNKWEADQTFEKLTNALNYNNMLMAYQLGLISKEEVEHSQLFRLRENNLLLTKRF